jgi:hypothetical protein
MSDKTFKQQIEEIINQEICSGSNCEYCDTYTPTCKKQQRDQAESRILAAHNAELGRIADGMPITTKLRWSEPLGDYEAYFSDDAKSQLYKCQAYIQAQKG